MKARRRAKCCARSVAGRSCTFADPSSEQWIWRSLARAWRFSATVPGPLCSYSILERTQLALVLVCPLCGA